MLYKMICCAIAPLRPYMRPLRPCCAAPLALLPSASRNPAPLPTPSCCAATMLDMACKVSLAVFG